MSERKEVLPEQTVDGSNYVRALIDSHAFGKTGRQQEAMLSDYELGKSAGRVDATLAAIAQVEALQARIAELEKPRVPDWDAVKDKRMSELTPEQRDDAQELWVRKHVGYFTESVEFLLRRLDEARGVK